MNRMILGAFLALVLVGIGLFWWQGRAEVEQGAPPPMAQPATPAPDDLPTADAGDLRGPAPPEATELTREEQRFFRYDRNRDRRITRNEMLSTRTDAFRKLDKDGNNLLDFRGVGGRHGRALRRRRRATATANSTWPNSRTTAPKPAKRKPALPLLGRLGHRVRASQRARSALARSV